MTLIDTPTLQALSTEARVECSRNLRMVEAVVPTVLFPTFFYVCFALIFQFGGPDASGSGYFLASMGSVGVIATGLMNTAIGTASERSAGWLTQRRVLALPASGWVMAKFAANLLFGLLALIPLFAIAAVFGEVRLATTDWLALAAVLLAGGLPFCALGLAIGSHMGERAAIAVANLVFLPMLFFSGLMLPVSLFPDWLAPIATLLPAHHLGALAWNVAGVEEGAVWSHWLTLALWGLLGAALTLLGLTRHSRRLA